jgi:Ni/Fe-hydrogenase subunit HybB-like protein
MGYWFLLEIIGFVFVPMMLFFYSFRQNNILLIKIASILTMIGVIMNRLNVSIIGYRWDATNHYFPSWMEFVVTLTVIFAQIWILRWVITRLPVHREPPSWVGKED